MSNAPVGPAAQSTDPALNVVSSLSQQPMQSVQDFHHADRCIILSSRQRTRWSAWTTPSEKGRQSGRSNDGFLVYAHCGHSAHCTPWTEPVGCHFRASQHWSAADYDQLVARLSGISQRRVHSTDNHGGEACETELKALRDVVSSHDRVVLLISGSSTQTNRYVGVVDVMNSLDFTKQTMLDADERLTQWHAPSVE